MQEENAMANGTVDTVEARIQELLEAAEGHREEIEQLQAALEQSEAQRGEEQVKMQEKLDSINKDKELECLRAVNDERRKWEAREERLLQQIAAWGQLRWRGHESGETSRDKERPHRSEESRQDLPDMESTLGETITLTVPEIGGSMGTASEPHPPMGYHITNGFTSGLLTHQLPPLAPFKGETTPDAETIGEWLERFAMLAQECGWTPRAKLLHLTSRLEKQAYAFYRSCAPQVKASYDLLTTALSERFTPVRIQGVDTSLFHDRKQKKDETVDQYAQELRRLHQKHTQRVCTEVKMPKELERPY